MGTFLLLLTGFGWLKRSQVTIKSGVCGRDQSSVKPPLICSALISTYQQDGVPLRIKRESYSPNPSSPFDNRSLSQLDTSFGDMLRHGMA
jgi:hypothetical protein